MKSAAWLENRRRGIGGSDANIILGGDKMKIHALWEEKLGLREPENLDWVLQVQIGSATEELNRLFFEHDTGRAVTHRNADTKSRYPWIRCELDGVTTTAQGLPAIIEFKNVSAFAKPDEIVARYMPQVAHNAYCHGVEWGILSVIFGNHKRETIEMQIDEGYTMALLSAEEAFWRCVETKVAPGGFVPVVTPAIPVRRVDMKGNNLWHTSAADWLENKDSHAAFISAAEAIKLMVEPDTKEAFGAGIRAVRAKNGAITIRKSDVAS